MTAIHWNALLLPCSKHFSLKERNLIWLWCMVGSDCFSTCLSLVHNRNKFIANILCLIVCVVYIKAIGVLVFCWLVDGQECDLIFVSLLETRDQGPLCLQPKGKTSWQACSAVGHTGMTKKKKQGSNSNANYLQHAKQFSAMTICASVPKINRKLHITPESH